MQILPKKKEENNTKKTKKNKKKQKKKKQTTIQPTKQTNKQKNTAVPFLKLKSPFNEIQKTLK